MPKTSADRIEKLAEKYKLAMPALRIYIKEKSRNSNNEVDDLKKKIAKLEAIAVKLA
jgi:hypothetical protein